VPHHTPQAHEHVQDTPQGGTWELFDRLFSEPVEIPLPTIFGFTVTKFMILEVMAALLIIAIYVPLARRVREGNLPKGPWWNWWEALLTFVRDEIARPTLGEHDADKYVPYLWTVFLFILFCNLFGLFPFLGSPTASIWVTAALALCSFVMMHGAAMMKMGVVHYFQSQWPHIHIGDSLIARGFGNFLSGVIYCIEMLGTVIKSFVLAVRLFANMFAGHMVLATILLFIVVVGNTRNLALWSAVTVGSVLGVVALSLLELFVAFLQAYIFTFLTALFMGMSLHPQH
jgi:F-type H+-transporting ATPase subunit a